MCWCFIHYGTECLDSIKGGVFIDCWSIHCLLGKGKFLELSNPWRKRHHVSSKLWGLIIQWCVMSHKNGAIIRTVLKMLGPKSFLVPGTYLTDCTASHPKKHSSSSQADDPVLNSDCTVTSVTVAYTRWFKYDQDWFVCKQVALRSSCATLREWSHNLHPPSCSG